MKSLNSFINEKLSINENQVVNYNVPVKELYRIAIEQGIKEDESYDKTWGRPWAEMDIKKPSPNTLSVEGCSILRCEIVEDPMPLHSGKRSEFEHNLLEYSKKVYEIFKKYWDKNINVTRTYETEGRRRFYKFECVFDEDIIIHIEYMGPLKDLNKYKI